MNTTTKKRRAKRTKGYALRPIKHDPSETDSDPSKKENREEDREEEPATPGSPLLAGLRIVGSAR